MPILAAYFDVSDISLLIENEKKDFELVNFPYTYSFEAFSNQCHKAAFYKAALEAVLRERKEKLSSFEVLAVGFLEAPVLPTKTILTTNLLNVLQISDNIYPIIVNNFSILTRDSVLSYEPSSKKIIGVDTSEKDEFANTSIYPQIIPTDMSITSALDRNIPDKLSSVDLGYESGATLAFGGSRFSRPVVNEYLDYILMVDLVKKPGTYNLYADRKNSAVLFSLLRMYQKGLGLDIKASAEPVGTLINSPGDTECLLVSEVGTTQFFGVKKDTLFIMPLDSNVKAKVKVKSKSLGSFETFVQGGKVGLIIDTRENKSPISDNVEVFNDCVRQLSLCLPRF